VSSQSDSYLSRLYQHLGKNRDYPRRAQRLGQEGTPVVLFTFDRNGRLLSYRITRESPHRLLDKAALDMLESANPLPEVPDDMTGETFTVQVPVRFSLN
jgi:protein TonB